VLLSSKTGVNHENAEQTKTQNDNANNEGDEGEASEITIYSSRDSMSDGKYVVECSINTGPVVLYDLCIFL
jgi:hypothetical protein